MTTVGLRIHVDMILGPGLAAAAAREASDVSVAHQCALWIRASQAAEHAETMLSSLPRHAYLVKNFSPQIKRNKEIALLLGDEARRRMTAFGPAEETEARRSMRHLLAQRSERWQRILTSVAHDVAREDLANPLPTDEGQARGGLAQAPFPGVRLGDVELSGRGRALLMVRLVSRGVSDDRLLDAFRAWERDLVSAYSGPGGLLSYRADSEDEGLLSKQPARSRVLLKA